MEGVNFVWEKFEVTMIEVCSCSDFGEKSVFDSTQFQKFPDKSVILWLAFCKRIEIEKFQKTSCLPCLSHIFFMSLIWIWNHFGANFYGIGKSIRILPLFCFVLWIKCTLILIVWKYLAKKTNNLISFRYTFYNDI